MQHPSQQFGCTREVRGRHIFDAMHVPQGTLDYQDIAIFEIRRNRRHGREPLASAIVHEDVACNMQKVHSVHFRQISSKQGRATRRWPAIDKDVWVNMHSTGVDARITRPKSEAWNRRREQPASAITRTWPATHKKFVQYTSGRNPANKG
ncbi:hypothetical protein M405DRAFT_821115 [Rhizopogon salebrosus TDB-379]|nr:hypothetical protein M405DRAFT_821115 [Rhizopogon salebrosus TDB-379]